MTSFCPHYKNTRPLRLPRTEAVQLGIQYLTSLLPPLEYHTASSCASGAPHSSLHVPPSQPSASGLGLVVMCRGPQL